MSAKNHLLASVEAALEGSVDVDLNMFLYRFRRELNAAHFKECPESQRLQTFRQVWKFLLTAAGNTSSNIRLAAGRATGSFLTRIVPHFPDLMHKSFTEVVRLTTFAPKSSAVIASSFAFLSSFVAPPFVARSLATDAILDHFASPDPTFAERLPEVISRLRYLGVDWPTRGIRAIIYISH
jgi:hypothetical protein